MKKIKTLKNIFITIGIILIILITTLVICYDNIVYNHTVKNIKKVEEYASQIVQNNTGQNTGFSWNGGQPENNWTYYNGFLMYALLQTGKYNDFVNNFYNNNIDENGHIKSYLGKPPAFLGYSKKTMIFHEIESNKTIQNENKCTQSSALLNRSECHFEKGLWNMLGE